MVWRDDDRDAFDGGHGGRKGKGKGKQLTKPCIWLGGLPPDVTETEVKRVAERFGVISEIAIKTSERDTFVFVTFGRIEHAQDAIDELNQSNAFGSGIIKAAPATRRSEGKGEGKGDSGWHSSEKWDEGKRDDDHRGRHSRDDKGGGRSRDNYGYDDYNRGRDDRDHYGSRSDRDRNDHGSARYEDQDRGGGNRRYEDQDHDRGSSHRGDYRGGYGKGRNEGKGEKGGKGGNRHGDEDYGSGRYGDRREGGDRGAGGRGMDHRYESRADDRSFRDDPRGAQSDGRDPRDRGRDRGLGVHGLDRRGPTPRPQAAYRPAGAMGAGSGAGGRIAPRRLATRSRSPAQRVRMQERGAQERGVKVELANLPSDMDEAELKDTAMAYGKVVNLRLFDNGANGPKRGWVEYETMRAAETAVSELDERSMAEWHLLLRAYIDMPPQAAGRERR